MKIIKYGGIVNIGNIVPTVIHFVPGPEEPSAEGQEGQGVLEQRQGGG